MFRLGLLHLLPPLPPAPTTGAAPPSLPPLPPPCLLPPLPPPPSTGISRQVLSVLIPPFLPFFSFSALHRNFRYCIFSSLFLGLVYLEFVIKMMVFFLSRLFVRMMISLHKSSLSLMPAAIWLDASTNSALLSNRLRRRERLARKQEELGLIDQWIRKKQEAINTRTMEQLADILS